MERGKKSTLSLSLVCMFTRSFVEFIAEIASRGSLARLHAHFHSQDIKLDLKVLLFPALSLSQHNIASRVEAVVKIKV